MNERSRNTNIELKLKTSISSSILSGESNLRQREILELKFSGQNSNEKIDLTKLIPFVYIIKINGSNLSRFIKIN